MTKLTPLDAYVLAYCEAYEGMSNGNWPRRLLAIREAYDAGFRAGQQASDNITKDAERKEKS